MVAFTSGVEAGDRRRRRHRRRPILQGLRGLPIPRDLRDRRNHRGLRRITTRILREDILHRLQCREAVHRASDGSRIRAISRALLQPLLRTAPSRRKRAVGVPAPPRHPLTAVPPRPNRGRGMLGRPLPASLPISRGRGTRVRRPRANPTRVSLPMPDPPRHRVIRTAARLVEWTADLPPMITATAVPPVVADSAAAVGSAADSPAARTAAEVASEEDTGRKH